MFKEVKEFFQEVGAILKEAHWYSIIAGIGGILLFLFIIGFALLLIISSIVSGFMSGNGLIVIGTILLILWIMCTIRWVIDIFDL